MTVASEREDETRRATGGETRENGQNAAVDGGVHGGKVREGPALLRRSFRSLLLCSSPMIMDLTLSRWNPWTKGQGTTRT